jgi:hypothetical protein
MKRNSTPRPIRKRAILALALVFACALGSLTFAANLAFDSQGYLFMHPFFKARPWRASVDRLDLILPSDSLAKYRGSMSRRVATARWRCSRQTTPRCSACRYDMKAL